MHTWLLATCLLAVHADAAHSDSRELARRIDQRIAERLDAEGVKPAERADDAEFLRRLSLDLIGRIPTAAEVREFLKDGRPDKRTHLVDRLLADPQHSRHFARVWRALLLPEAEIDSQIAYFQPGFEAWLAQRRHENAGFDKIVRELITVPIVGPDQPPQFVLRDLRRPNPVAFLASKQAEPAKIATSCVRIFLGVRLECAQCHDHPFDRWTQRQFWSQAAFFAGLQRRGRGPFAPLVETVDHRTSRLAETDKMVPAALLDGSAAHFDKQTTPRVQLAEWMTSRQNTFFARAAANRIWGQLMGRGLVDPVDDFRESNPPSHPELLEALSADFAASGFDLTRLYRAICLSSAYQRTSGRTGDRQSRPELYASMSIKPLSGDQFYDCLAQVIGNSPTDEPGRSEDNQDQDTLRRQLIRMFAADEEAGYPKTSVAQALTLMNGSAVSEAVAPKTSTRLKQTLAASPASADRQVEDLYLTALSRYPTEVERRMMVDYCREAAAAEHARRLGDVFWVLLNSAEFRWNH